jgi:hypothetical protein
VFSAQEGIHLRVRKAWLQDCVVANERSPLSVLIWAELPQVHLPEFHPPPPQEMLVREKVQEILAAWWQQVMPEEMLF